jgi:hypothetical protein
VYKEYDLKAMIKMWRKLCQETEHIREHKKKKLFVVNEKKNLIYFIKIITIVGGCILREGYIFGDVRETGLNDCRISVR